MKAKYYKILLTVPNYAEAAAMVAEPGDCAVVERAGVQRQIVMRCPDDCGETLSINLDRRSGPAWRLYKRHRVWSLFPSIDRTTGCLSHFILWRGRILWCSGLDEYEGEMSISPTLLTRITEAVKPCRSVSLVQLSEELDEIPWDVLAACRSLARRRVLVEKRDELGKVFFYKR